MAVDRAHAVSGQPLVLDVYFRNPNTDALFDPAQIDQVDILAANGQTVLQTIPSGSVTRIDVGQYQVTTDPQAAGVVLDRWTYRMVADGTVYQLVERTSVTQAPSWPTSVENQSALPRNSAVVLRPISLTIEFRDANTNELYDPYQVRQVEILQTSGTLIETILSIVHVGIGKYRIQANAVASACTISDKWYFTPVQGASEQTRTQYTQVQDQAALGIVQTPVKVPEQLYADVAAHGAEIVLYGSLKKVGINYRDSSKAPANPGLLTLEVTDLAGNLVLADVYLPPAERDPNPPRIINPQAGRFDFPFGADNGLTGTTKKNKTELGDYLFRWHACATAPIQSTLTIDGPNTNDAIVWTAVAYGTPGDFITVAYVDPGTPNAALSVVRSGADITVNLATDGGGAIITTAGQIVAAVAASATVSDIVMPFLAANNNGTGVVAAAPRASLTGGVDGTDELVVTVPVKVISHRVLALVPRLRLLIDKAVKMVDEGDPDNPCFLGYSEGQLVQFIGDGLHIINAYQPSGIFSFENYPYDQFEFTLIEAALMAGVMSQQLFAVDTDIPNWNDQGNAFVIQHQPQLANFLTFLSQRLDKMIPLMKLNFVNSGSIHIEAGPNYRLAQLIAAAPSGALFRNMYFKG